MSVTSKAPHSFTLTAIHAARAAVACEMNGHRYHVWISLHPTASSIESAELAVYKNCAKGLVRGDTGWFATRTLDGSLGQGRVVREALLLAAPDLVTAARAEEQEAKRARAATQAEHERMHKVRDAAPELLAKLRDALEAVRVGPPEAIGYSRSEKSVFDAGWNAALNVVYGRHEAARELVERLEADAPAGAAMPA